MIHNTDLILNLTYFLLVNPSFGYFVSASFYQNEGCFFGVQSLSYCGLKISGQVNLFDYNKLIFKKMKFHTKVESEMLRSYTKEAPNKVEL